MHSHSVILLSEYWYGSAMLIPGRGWSFCLGRRRICAPPSVVLRSSQQLTAAGTARYSVHPRVRGDSVIIQRRGQRKSGSPPRARGQLPMSRAGRTCLTVHPRVRGDSPVDHRGDVRGVRFTPACAGTAIRHTERDSRVSVHPRVRGDSPSAWATSRRSRGSPPRARGQPRLGPLLLRFERFTPACAGTASCTVARRRARPVHPRVRGDSRSPSALMTLSCGSPPRARGQRRLRHPPQRPTRFTPACAGTASPPRRQ